MCLTAGQASDLQGAEALLPSDAERTLIAVKGYDALHHVIAPALRASK